MEGTGRVRGVRKIERVGAMVEAIERCRPVVSEIAGWTAVSRTRPDGEEAALETLDEERPSDGTAAVQQSPEEPFGRKVAELVQAKKGQL